MARALALNSSTLSATAAGVHKKAAPFLGEPRIAGGAIEELYAKLRFQIRQRLAHHGLGAAQLATRGREASSSTAAMKVRNWSSVIASSIAIVPVAIDCYRNI